MQRPSARAAALLAVTILVGGGASWFGARALGVLPSADHAAPSHPRSTPTRQRPIEVPSRVPDALPGTPVGTAVGIARVPVSAASILTATGHWYEAPGALGLSPNGRYLVSDPNAPGTENFVVLRDLSSTLSPRYFFGITETPSLLGWSSDSRWILFSDLSDVGHERAVRIDLATGEQISFDYDRLPALPDAKSKYTLPFPLTGSLRQDGMLVLVRRGSIPRLPDDVPQAGPMDVFTVDPVKGSIGQFHIDNVLRWQRAQPGSIYGVTINSLDASYAWLVGHDDQLVLRIASRIVQHDSANAVGTTTVYDLATGRRLRNLTAADPLRIATGGTTLTCTTVDQQMQTVEHLDPTTGHTTRVEQFAWGPEGGIYSDTEMPGDTFTGPQVQLPGDTGNTL